MNRKTIMALSAVLAMMTFVLVAGEFRSSTYSYSEIPHIDVGNPGLQPTPTPICPPPAQPAPVQRKVVGCIACPACGQSIGLDAFKLNQCEQTASAPLVAPVVVPMVAPVASEVIVESPPVAVVQSRPAAVVYSAPTFVVERSPGMIMTDQILSPIAPTFCTDGSCGISNTYVTSSCPDGSCGNFVYSEIPPIPGGQPPNQPIDQPDQCTNGSCLLSIPSKAVQTIRNGVQNRAQNRFENRQMQIRGNQVYP